MNPALRRCSRMLSGGISAVLMLSATGLQAGSVVEEKVEHAGVKFRVVRAAPAEVMLVWKDPQGEPYRSFDQWVNFWDFAGLFLKLGCQDALFLDGNLSQMLVNPSKPVPSNLFGAMFVIAD